MQNYINRGNASKMRYALRRSKTLTAANLDAFIASSNANSRETRLEALANLKIMKMWEKDLNNPILSRFVDNALEELKGKVPGDGEIVKAPSETGG